MANTCYFDMLVKGTKENCKEFLNIMKGTHERYFGRVEFGYPQETDYETHYEISTDGECAWSVVCTMVESVSYCDRNTPSTTLLEESKLLDLDIEVYSSEASMEFAEHYHYKNGEVLAEECVDYFEYFWDKDEFPTLEEFNDYYGTSFTTKDFYDDLAIAGGFPNAWADTPATEALVDLTEKAQ